MQAKEDHRVDSCPPSVSAQLGTADVTLKMLQALGPCLRTVSCKHRSSPRKLVLHHYKNGEGQEMSTQLFEGFGDLFWNISVS